MSEAENSVYIANALNTEKKLLNKKIIQATELKL